MMAKLDEMKRATTLGTRPGAYPPGTDPAQAIGKPARLAGVRGDRSTAWISLDRIDRDPDQPREDFDEPSLRNLADSLRTKGQLQPVRVRWDEGRGVYLLIAGERRWRAAKMAGLIELQAVIHETNLAPDDLLGLQLVENALREDLKPVEQAKAYRRLMEARGWTMTELAAELNLHQTTVSRALSLLDLHGAVQTKVDQGELAASAAAEIAKLASHQEQLSVVAAVEGQGLGRDEVAELVRAVKSRRSVPAVRPQPVTIDLGGCTVQVRWKKADGITAQQALRKAIKILQEQEAAVQRGEDGDQEAA